MEEVLIDKEEGDALEGRAAERQRRRPPGTGWGIRRRRVAPGRHRNRNDPGGIGGRMDAGRQPAGDPRPDGWGVGGAGARAVHFRTAGRAAGRSGRPLRVDRARQHRGRMDRGLPSGRRGIPGAQARDV
jgi:hypothetical protein